MLGSFGEGYGTVKLISGSMDLTRRPLQIIQVIVVCRWVIKAFWTDSGRLYSLP